MSVEWSEAPKIVERNDWVAIGDELRTRPGQWAQVAQCLSSRQSAMAAHRIRRGLDPGLGIPGRFEAKARKVDYKYLVFARWVPSGWTDS